MGQNTYLERGMMKFKKILLSLMVIGLILPLFTVSASASSKTIPKKLRGTWVSKAQYQYNSKHHTRKTMWLPKLKLTVYKKSAKWQMVGSLPIDGGHYDHKKHIIKSTQYRYGMVTLKGKTLLTHQNFLAPYGKKLMFATENGTSIPMTRAK